MSNGENLIPNDYWDTLSNEEKQDMEAALSELDYFMSVPEWDEMDDDYYTSMRIRFNKNEKQIGPREYKSFKCKNLPIWMMVMPAGKQHDGNIMVQYFHTITEDMEEGECNGSYELVTEAELEKKFNIKYNN